MDEQKICFDILLWLRMWGKVSLVRLKFISIFIINMADDSNEE